MKTTGVYKIINLQNSKYYVGSSNDIKKRLRDHRYRLNKNTHDNPHLQSAWNKYGSVNFSFILVEKCINCKEVEQNYLNVARLESNKCYNTSFVVDHPPRLTEEQEKHRRERISAALIQAHKRDPQLKNRMRETTLLQFKNGFDRIGFSKMVKLGMRQPGVIEKIRFARRDKTVYSFSHLDGRTFTGTRYAFQEQFTFRRDSVARIICGKRTSHHGWKITS